MNETELVRQRELAGRTVRPLGRVLAGLASIAVVAFGVVAPLGVAAAHTAVPNRDLILPRQPATLSAATVRPPAACKGVTISGFAFHPAKVVENKPATLAVAIRNCTTKPFRGSLETYGMVCAVVDPINVPVTVAAGATHRSTQTYSATFCTGKGHITGSLQLKGKVISLKTAYVTIVAPTG